MSVLLVLDLWFRSGVSSIEQKCGERQTNGKIERTKKKIPRNDVEQSHSREITIKWTDIRAIAKFQRKWGKKEHNR